MPVISPLAIAGAAPRMTTKRIAPSSSWNSAMASGNQAIDGIVWMPVIIEPIARRTIFELDTAKTDGDADDDRRGEADDRPLERDR